jgi:hypothetical protein
LTTVKWDSSIVFNKQQSVTDIDTKEHKKWERSSTMAPSPERCRSALFVRVPEDIMNEISDYNLGFDVHKTYVYVAVIDEGDDPGQQKLNI